MWPWDHLAIGYLVVSLWRRGRSRRPPGEAEAIAAVVGSQLPDLIDKPLGWRTSLLPSGHSLAHSLTVAAPTAVVVYLLARRYGRADVGAAFSLAYLVHLPADVVYPMVLGDPPNLAFLFWPFVDIPPSQTDAFAGRVLELVVQFLAFLRTPQGLTFLLVELSLLGVALLLWRRDGWPGVASVVRAVDPRSV
ncbi:LexA-binding, inner membrane-associated putative hydrolase [Halomicrobium zhouii]|uniref:LexA-binding, inner membrane-associated putative hydrolase n=1 Tax=Halomicrobium zhouii TaxID=767519 RepID=A0A1I6M530_9EURY|nr:metal-dependent hydrolase [Halomicrobium zhouii]SFS10738.1 LexA-binding, inner membrane-associated putative hydrolase [Halomicrobium zhouii]